MNLQNLKQENGTLLMIKTMGNMAMEMKMVQLLNLKQKSLNQVFVNTQMRMLVTGDIAAAGSNQNTSIAFCKYSNSNCALFRRCVTHINDNYVEIAENLDIIMAMYNFLEYSDNYADSSGSLWQFKRVEQNMTDAGNPDNVTDNSSSFKYKSSLLKGLASRDIAANTNPKIVGAHRLFTNAKIAVPLKYLSNFFRSLAMQIINCKIHLELNWTKNCVMSTVGDNDNKTTFQITSKKLYVPTVTLSTKDNVNLTKQLNDGFKKDQSIGMNINQK